MYCSEMRPYQTHSSPLEAAEAGTQTVGHSPQGCRPFRVAPPMPLSVVPCSFQKPAVSVDPTMAHRTAEVAGLSGFPRRCLLSVQLMRIIGEMRSPVNKNLSQKPREIVHLDKATRRNQSILKKAFQIPTSSSAGRKDSWKLALASAGIRARIYPCRQNCPVEILPCAAGSRAAAPQEPGFGFLGRNAAEREQNILCSYSCFPAASFALISLNPSSSRMRSKALSSSAAALVIPFSMAFFNSWIAIFFSPSSACAVATR